MLAHVLCICVPILITLKSSILKLLKNWSSLNGVNLVSLITWLVYFSISARWSCSWYTFSMFISMIFSKFTWKEESQTIYLTLRVFLLSYYWFASFILLSMKWWGCVIKASWITSRISVTILSSFMLASVLQWLLITSWLRLRILKQNCLWFW